MLSDRIIEELKRTNNGQGAEIDHLKKHIRGMLCTRENMNEYIKELEDKVSERVEEKSVGATKRAAYEWEITVLKKQVRVCHTKLERRSKAVEDLRCLLDRAHFSLGFSELARDTQAKQIKLLRNVINEMRGL